MNGPEGVVFSSLKLSWVKFDNSMSEIWNFADAWRVNELSETGPEPAGISATNPSLLNSDASIGDGELFST